MKGKLATWLYPMHINVFLVRNNFMKPTFNLSHMLFDVICYQLNGMFLTIGWFKWLGLHIVLAVDGLAAF